MRLQQCKDVLFNESSLPSQMSTLRSYNHDFFLEKINKVGLSCFDDKRYLLNNGVKNYAYDHYKTEDH